MRTPPKILIGLSVAAVLVGGLPNQAQTAGARPWATTAVQASAPRGLDLTNTGPSEAIRAAQAARAPSVPSNTIVVDAQPVETATSTVPSLTVRPEARGVVIASSDAASLISPDFTAADAQDPPLAVGIGNNTAIGRRVVTNDPPPAGLLKNNPELMGSPLRGEIAITSVF